MKRYTKLALLTLTASAMLPAVMATAAAQGGADSRPTVAVMYFNNGAIGAANRELDPLRKGIADMLLTEMASRSDIRVVERDQLQEVVKEQDLGASGRVDQETAAKIGKILGARHMIFGGFVTSPKGELVLTGRAVNVETSQIVFTTTARGKTEDMLDVIADLAKKLNEGLHLPAMPRGGARPSGGEGGTGAMGGAAQSASTQPATTQPATTQPATGAQPAGQPASQGGTSNAQRSRRGTFQAALTYARALEAKDAGNTDEAVRLLNRTMHDFPDNAVNAFAQRELTKIQNKSGT